MKTFKRAKPMPRIGCNQGRLDAGSLAVTRMVVGLSPEPGDPRETATVACVCAWAFALLLMVLTQAAPFNDKSATILTAARLPTQLQPSGRRHLPGSPVRRC